MSDRRPLELARHAEAADCRRRGAARPVGRRHRGAARLPAGLPPRRSRRPAPTGSRSGTRDAPAKRGDILDRHGHVLATSVDADSIYAVPSEIDDRRSDGRGKLCGALGDCSATRTARRCSIASRTQRSFAYVRRQVSPDEARRVAALNLDGIGFIKESRRFYPEQGAGRAPARLRRHRQQRLSGLESTYDSQIRGKPGTVLIQTDARRHAFSRFERPPTTGSTVELTIDEYLQHIAERELHAGVVANRAAGGTAIIMNPRTGEILAMANEPTFNPNAYRDVAETRAAQPGGAGSLRAGLDLQDRHGVGGDRREGHAGRHADRHQSRRHPDRHPRRRRISGTQLRRAVVHRRDRQVEQRRRDQDRLQGRHRAAEPLRAALRIRPARLARLSRREPRHRLEPGASGPRARWRRCRWAIRSA